jgi:hypothetical protein
MKCLACDRILTDFEATRKTESGAYLDLCNHCFYSGVNEEIPVLEREDLKENKDQDLEEDYFDSEAI